MIARRKDLFCYLENNKFFSNYKVVSKKSGLSNTNYIIESNSNKYIIRFNKRRPPNFINSLENERNVLKFFENEKIEFVPRSLFYDKVNNIHILTYLQGKKIRFKNISPSGMKQVLGRLHEINSLAGEYNNYCIKNKIIKIQPKSEVENFKKFIYQQLCLVENNNFFYQYKSWIFDRLEKDFQNYKINKNIFYLNHGDPADNLIVNNRKISIIDWEYVKFTHGPGLVHILAHGGLSSKKEQALLGMYSRISGIDYRDLCIKTYTEKLIYYLFKMVKIINKKNKGNDYSNDDINLNNIKNAYLEKYKILELMS